MPLDIANNIKLLLFQALSNPTVVATFWLLWVKLPDYSSRDAQKVFTFKSPAIQWSGMKKQKDVANDVKTTRCSALSRYPVQFGPNFKQRVPLDWKRLKASLLQFAINSLSACSIYDKYSPPLYRVSTRFFLHIFCRRCCGMLQWLWWSKIQFRC